MCTVGGSVFRLLLRAVGAVSMLHGWLGIYFQKRAGCLTLVVRAFDFETRDADGQGQAVSIYTYYTSRPPDETTYRTDSTAASPSRSPV